MILEPIDDGRAGSPLDDVLLELAEGALEDLDSLTSWDCCCDSEIEGICTGCMARKAADKIQRLAYPVVRSSVSENRLDGAERVYFDRWIKENTRVPGINGGHGLLELIMSDDPNKRRARITQKDMDVATAVVQWLGTNCGLCFVQQCEVEVKRRHDLEREDWSPHQLHGVPWEEYANAPEAQQLAEIISNRFAKTEVTRARLLAEIRELLKYASSGASASNAESSIRG